MRTRRDLLCAVITFCACSVLLGGPKLGLEPQTFEWGRQAENKGVYEYSFTLKNEGDDVLEITNVRPGCGCTKVDLKKRSLAPGESTKMTGSLTTKGVEGHMRKGIILTTNDPTRKTSIASLDIKTSIASLDIRFAYAGEGLRSKYSSYGARLRRGALWAYVYVENCEEKTPIVVQAMELPEGWDCADTLPLTVPPEEKQTLRLTKPVGEGVEPEAFTDLAFRILTDCDKSPSLDGKISYRPQTPAATIVSKASSAPGGKDDTPTIRWPMTTPLESADENE